MTGYAVKNLDSHTRFPVHVHMLKAVVSLDFILIAEFLASGTLVSNLQTLFSVSNQVK